MNGYLPSWPTEFGDESEIGDTATKPQPEPQPVASQSQSQGQGPSQAEHTA